jgi:hypothetical protein
MFRSQPKPSSLPDVSKEKVEEFVSTTLNVGHFSSVEVAEHVDSAAQSLQASSAMRSAARLMLNSTRQRQSEGTCP